jgi:hypothetical protein
MKRGIGVFVILFLVVSVLFMSMSFVSAQSGPVQAIGNFIEGLFEIIEPVTNLIIGAAPGGEFVFVKILLMIIIFSFVWLALNQAKFFSDHRWVMAFIAVIVTILATRFLATEATIRAILLPYSTLGIAITAGLPFIIYFFIVNMGFKGPHKYFRRFAWIFFAAIFISLWIFRFNEIGGIGRLMYLLAAVGAIIMLFADGTINKLMTEMKIERAAAGNIGELVMDQQDKINEANRRFAERTIDDAERKELIKGYRKTIRDLRK